MAAPMISCPLCMGENFQDIPSFQNKIENVLKRELKCPICNLTLKGLNSLQDHLKSHLVTRYEQIVATFNEEFDNPKVNKRVMITPNNELLNSNNVLRVEGTPKDISEKVKLSESFRIESEKNYKNLIKSPAYSDLKQKISNISTSENLVDTLSIENIDLNDTYSDHFFGEAIKNISKSPINRSKFFENQNLNLNCDLCGLNFCSEYLLSLHRNVMHTNSTINCNICNTAVQNLDEYKEHIESEHVNEKNNSNKNEISEQLEQSKLQAQNIQNTILSKQIVESKSWECDECKKIFTTKYFLKKHKRLHTGETPYACEECGKTFAFQQSYHKHIFYHSDAKPHACPHCGRAFKETSTLQNHIRIHTGEKPFACTTCGKSFRQRVSYLVHQRIHNGSLPYKCESCNRSFRYKVSLRSHKCYAQRWKKLDAFVSQKIYEETHS